MTIVQDLEGLLPQWMVGAYRETVAPYMTTVAVTLDALKGLIDQGRLGWLPGQQDIPGDDAFDNFDALPLILRDRYLRAGFFESPYSQADRARRWLEEWARGATPRELLEQLAAILSPNPPTMRIVNGSGVWWTRDPSGNIAQYTAAGAGFFYEIDNAGNASVTAENIPAHAWDWDSGAEPPPFGFEDPTRFWVIIYAPCNLPLLAAISGLIGDGRTIGVGKGGPDATTVGTVAPSKEVELIRNLVFEWRAAGLRCSHFLITFGARSDYYNPDGSSPDYPHGDYGWPCHILSNVMSPARNTYTRFWRAEPGGVAGTL